MTVTVSGMTFAAETESPMLNAILEAYFEKWATSIDLEGQIAEYLRTQLRVDRNSQPPEIRT
jgi:transposase